MPTASRIVPTALPPNLVWRSYLGGSVLRRFRGLPGTGDNHFPEDWLASTVLARNGAHAQHPQEGLSRVADVGRKPHVGGFAGEGAGGLAGPRQAELPAGAKAAGPLEAARFIGSAANPGASRRAVCPPASEFQRWQDRVLVHPQHARARPMSISGFQHPPTRAGSGRT